MWARAAGSWINSSRCWASASMRSFSIAARRPGNLAGHPPVFTPSRMSRCPAGYSIIVADSKVRHQNTRSEFNVRVAEGRIGVALAQAALSADHPSARSGSAALGGGGAAPAGDTDSVTA